MFKSVTFEENDHGSYRVIASVQGAMRVLIAWSGDEQAPEYFAAADACEAAIEGHGSEETAREAFRTALLAAGVFVRE